MTKLQGKIAVIILNFAGALIFIFLLGWFTMSKLDNYTRHDEIIEVPSFTGMTQKQATDEAERKNLRLSVADSVYKPEAEPGSIIDQYPYAGSSVKRNRIIHLTVNTTEAAQTAMPSLANTAFRQCVYKLNAAGFKIGHLHYEESDYRNLVIGFIHGSDTVKAGDMLPKGATVDIILGTGNRAYRENIPDVCGQTLRDAANTLLGSYLNAIALDKNGNKIETEEHLNDYVFRQYPRIDSLVEAGSSVYLYTTPNKASLTKLMSQLDSVQHLTIPVFPEIEFTEETDPGLSEVMEADSLMNTDIDDDIIENL